jgi:hypothetical protein
VRAAVNKQFGAQAAALAVLKSSISCPRIWQGKGRRCVAAAGRRDASAAWRRALIDATRRNVRAYPYRRARASRASRASSRGRRWPFDEGCEGIFMQLEHPRGRSMWFTLIEDKATMKVRRCRVSDLRVLALSGDG